MKTNEELLEEIEELKAELRREREITSSMVFALNTLRAQPRSSYNSALHLRQDNQPEIPVCRAHGSDIRLTTTLADVTCLRCIALHNKRDSEKRVKSASG